jgi:hypothetical protein
LWNPFFEKFFFVNMLKMSSSMDLWKKIARPRFLSKVTNLAPPLNILYIAELGKWSENHRTSYFVLSTTQKRIVLRTSYYVLSKKKTYFVLRTTYFPKKIVLSLKSNVLRTSYYVLSKIKRTSYYVLSKTKRTSYYVLFKI